MKEVQNLPVQINMVSELKRKSLINTSQIFSPTLVAMPVAKVSTATHEETPEPQQRINVGSNLSKVQRTHKSSQVLRVLKSQTFKPLPPPEQPESAEGDVFIAECKEAKSNIKRTSKDKVQQNANLDKKIGYQKIVKPVKEMSLAEREKLHEAQGAKGYTNGDSPLSFDERWEYEEGRGATTNPRLMSKEEHDRFYNSSEEESTPERISLGAPLDKKMKQKTKQTKQKTDQHLQGERQKRKNAIAEAVIWAADVNNPNAPDLLETAGIAVHNVKEFGKKTLPVVKKAVKTGFHATKAGIQGFNELSEEIVKNPMLIRMGENNEATLRGMASQARHAKCSIAAVGNRKMGMTAGSLITQKRFGKTNNPTTTYNNPGTGASNPYGITAKYEKGSGGRIELHFYYKGNRITHEQVSKVLTPNQIHRLKEAALGQPTNKVTTTTYTTQTTTNFGGMHHKTASGLVRRNKGGLGTTNQKAGSVVNVRKVASTSGLIHRHHSGVV